MPILEDHTILVLMSTYNGEQYIAEQLDSLIAQEGVNLSVYIRDDGSTDATHQVLQDYAERYPQLFNIKLSSNIGAKLSFFELIFQSNELIESIDFIAFCDQDDVWDKHKLYRAITMLGKENPSVPLMYCSSTQMVDVALSPLDVWPLPPTRPLAMNNALVENIAVGCTTVLNLPAYKLINAHMPLHPEQVIMHDWWCYLCVSTFGKVIFDPTPFIKYRQHSSNVQGGSSGKWITNWYKRVMRYFYGTSSRSITNQAREFQSCLHNRFNTEQFRIVQNFVMNSEGNFFRRLIYILNSPLLRQSRIDNLAIRVIYLLKRL